MDNMNKWLKFSLYILVILTTVVLTSTVVLGYNYTNFGSSSSGGSAGTEQVLSVSSNVYSLIKPVGYIIAVVLVFALAIQYMTASPNKKATIMERSWMYTVGIVLLVTIPTLMDWAAEIGVNVRGTGPAYTNGSAGSSSTLNVGRDAPDDGEGVNSLFDRIKGWMSSGNNTGEGGSGGGTPSSGGNPIGSGGGTSQPSTGQPSESTEGYRSPSSIDPTNLKVGDRIYFSVDTSDPYLPSGGDWNDPEVYYDLQSGDVIEFNSTLGGYKLTIANLADRFNDTKWSLGQAITEKGSNCFSQIKGVVVTNDSSI